MTVKGKGKQAIKGYFLSGFDITNYSDMMFESLGFGNTVYGWKFGTFMI